MWQFDDEQADFSNERSENQAARCITLGQQAGDGVRWTFKGRLQGGSGLWGTHKIQIFWYVKAQRQGSYRKTQR